MYEVSQHGAKAYVSSPLHFNLVHVTIFSFVFASLYHAIRHCGFCWSADVPTLVTDLPILTRCFVQLVYWLRRDHLTTCIHAVS